MSTKTAKEIEDEKRIQRFIQENFDPAVVEQELITFATAGGGFEEWPPADYDDEYTDLEDQFGGLLDLCSRFDGSNKIIELRLPNEYRMYFLPKEEVPEKFWNLAPFAKEEYSNWLCLYPGMCRRISQASPFHIPYDYFNPLFELESVYQAVCVTLIFGGFGVNTYFPTGEIKTANV